MIDHALDAILPHIDNARDNNTLSKLFRQEKRNKSDFIVYAP